MVECLAALSTISFRDSRQVNSEPSVLDYRPEAVLVNLGDGRQVPALCYNIPHVSGTSRNTEYAVRLFEVAKALSLPGEYLNKLQNLAQ